MTGTIFTIAQTTWKSNELMLATIYAVSPPLINLGAILLSLNSQANLSVCGRLQWTCSMSIILFTRYTSNCCWISLAYYTYCALLTWNLKGCWSKKKIFMSWTSQKKQSHLCFVLGYSALKYYASMIQTCRVKSLSKNILWLTSISVNEFFHLSCHLSMI